MSDLESRLRTALHDETVEVAARPDLAEDMVTRGTTVRRRRRVVGGAAGLVVLAALVPVWRTIDTSSDPVHMVTTPKPTSISQSPAPDPNPSTPTTPKLTWSTEAVSVLHSPRRQTRVLGVRVAPHPNYDRVVIDLGGAIPSYHVATTPRLVYDGSGERVPLHGASFLTVRLNPATGHQPGHSTIGPDKQIYEFPSMRGYAVIGDNEGVVSFGLALSGNHSFRVFDLRSPTRLVIDIHH